MKASPCKTRQPWTVPSTVTMHLTTINPCTSFCSACSVYSGSGPEIWRGGVIRPASYSGVGPGPAGANTSPPPAPPESPIPGTSASPDPGSSPCTGALASGGSRAGAISRVTVSRGGFGLPALRSGGRAGCEAPLRPTVWGTGNLGRTRRKSGGGGGAVVRSPATSTAMAIAAACAAIAQAVAVPERLFPGLAIASNRSEEHTSELQSHVNLVCRLLLEKKKKKIKRTLIHKKKKKQTKKKK